MDWQRRRQLDFWLLAAMVGIWVYWLLLYRTHLLTLSDIIEYLEMFWRNKLPIFLFSIAGFSAFICIHKNKRILGIMIFFLAFSLGYWAYGPDFPKVPPLDPPKVFWKQLSFRIPVMLAITYNYLDKHRGASPPYLFRKIEYWLTLYGTWIKGEIILNLQEQSKKALEELAKNAGEDEKIFKKCLNLALLSISAKDLKPYLPIFAEKRYDRLNGQLSWYFGFASLREEKSNLILIGASPIKWVSVRIRFPQKVRLLEDYSDAGGRGDFDSFIRAAVVIIAYVIFLKILRYAFDRWF